MKRRFLLALVSMAVPAGGQQGRPASAIRDGVRAWRKAHEKQIPTPPRSKS
jgi:hypothetical protein